jgi:membrane glycosyltransferase
VAPGNAILKSGLVMQPANHFRKFSPGSERFFYLNRKPTAMNYDDGNFKRTDILVFALALGLMGFWVFKLVLDVSVSGAIAVAALVLFILVRIAVSLKDTDK